MAEKNKIVVVKMAGQGETRQMKFAKLPVTGKTVRLDGAPPFRGLFRFDFIGHTTQKCFGRKTTLPLYEVQQVTEASEGGGLIRG